MKISEVMTKDVFNSQAKPDDPGGRKHDGQDR